MTKQRQADNAALQAYADYESQVTGRHLRVGCWLVMVLMPAGVFLDYFVYPERLWFFLGLRLTSVVVAAAVWAFLNSQLSQRYQQALGLFIALIPVFFICWMIYAAPDDKGGAAGSPYYAGLNLSLLAIAFVLRWSVTLSVLASIMVLVMYLGACLMHGPIPNQQRGAWANNLYFLTITSVIVVVGSRLHRDLRLREFTVRYELDERTRELEATLRRLREAEAQLLQQEKMASLGVMSAGIIHEINNPLNFAATSLFSLRKKARHLPADQQADYQEALTEVEEGLSRVKNIVSDLRLFTHPNAEAPEDVDVAEALDTAARLLAGELKDPIRLERNLPAGLTVRANRNKLVHVLINLLQNALDALRHKPPDARPPTIRVEGRAENHRALVTVEDNGPGIRPEDQPRVFDPFFTTKDVGEGMGLGLSICYRLMREFHGDIRLESEPGRYCRFTLEFPSAPTARPAAS